MAQIQLRHWLKKLWINLKRVSDMSIWLRLGYFVGPLLIGLIAAVGEYLPIDSRMLLIASVCYFIGYCDRIYSEFLKSIK